MTDRIKPEAIKLISALSIAFERLHPECGGLSADAAREQVELTSRFASAADHLEHAFLAAFMNGDLRVFITDPKTNQDYRIQPDEISGAHSVHENKARMAFLFADEMLFLADSPLAKFNGRTPWLYEAEFEDWLSNSRQPSDSKKRENAKPNRPVSDKQLEADFAVYRSSLGPLLPTRQKVRKWAAEKYGARVTTDRADALYAADAKARPRKRGRPRAQISRKA